MLAAQALIPQENTALDAYVESARKYASKSKAANTIDAYGAAWREFQGFALARCMASLPAQPALVIAYLTALADSGAKSSTIGVKRAAISYYHRKHKHIDPTADEDVRIVMSGIRRELGTDPAKKAPVTLAELRVMIAALPDTLAGKRDRALLLVGWAGAFRRSELVSLDIEDCHINGKLTIKLRKSKTDQEGKGCTKTIPEIDDKELDPMTALRVWLLAANIKSGPIFRQIDKWGHVRETRLNDKSVANIVKSVAEAAGFESSQFAGHSLRSGFITSAAGANVPEWAIQQQTGHKSERVLRGYIQDAGAGSMSAVKAAFGE